nr:MAG TPA: hypothetical protein [Caudoviricetes sp.]
MQCFLARLKLHKLIRIFITDCTKFSVQFRKAMTVQGAQFHALNGEHKTEREVKSYDKIGNERSC